MGTDLQTRAARTLLALHRQKRGFVLPNCWDVGSALILTEAGFPAIATTSAGVAFSLGKPDYQTGDKNLGVSREEMFAAIRPIVEAVHVPVSADLEAGYGASPKAVATTIRMAIDAGLAGGNIEDRIRGERRLYDEALAVERIRAARAAIDARGGAFVLNARTDAFVMPKGGLKVVIRRANLFAEAGADCIFTPGAPDIETVRTLVKEIDAPVNLVSGLGRPVIDPATLIALGVKRVTVGGSIARAAYGLAHNAARELHEAGTMNFANQQMGQDDLNALFAKARRRARRRQ